MADGINRRELATPVVLWERKFTRKRSVTDYPPHLLDDFTPITKTHPDEILTSKVSWQIVKDVVEGPVSTTGTSPSRGIRGGGRRKVSSNYYNVLEKAVKSRTYSQWIKARRSSFVLGPPGRYRLKAGGMRITQHKSPKGAAGSSQDKLADDADLNNAALKVSTSPPKTTTISGAPMRGHSDFPTEAVQSFHDKPVPTHDTSRANAAGRPNIIHQPRKQASQRRTCTIHTRDWKVVRSTSTAVATVPVEAFFPVKCVRVMIKAGHRKSCYKKRYCFGWRRKPQMIQRF
ncbi:hypothetical protein AAG570_007521 [Ranatra chinensis]|uniref:Histone H1 n=1 Tax=Ranatra chinensis TaxID=642074 RepID=A0ABD0XW37_9HEMI